jgi:diguanylate cyclase (GGDEF)-like protein/PAS domain S-box-containing protein
MGIVVLSCGSGGVCANMAEAGKTEGADSLKREKSRLESSVREHVRTEKALETERDFLAAVLAAADTLILVLDSAGRILQINRAVELAMGYSADDLCGRMFISTLPIREVAAGLREDLRRLEKGGGPRTFESHWATSTGERLLVHGSLAPLRDSTRTLSHIIVTASDVTQRRALEDELRAMSLRDDMTGLYNRRGFALLAEQQLKDSRRSESTLAIVYADVDHLKSINDAFGHGAGDIAIITCAQALEVTFRESDIVARIGGDEFVVLAEADARKLDLVSRRLNRELDRRTADSGLQFPVSLTIGSAHSKPPHRTSLDALLQQADAFMYEHKHEEKESRE